MQDFLKTQKVYTILELNTAIRAVIKSEFPEYIWVCGEIQDFRASRNKRHIYFSLVQKHPEVDEIIARVSAAIFEGHKAGIFRRLKDADPLFELRDDIEVKLLCEVDLYPKTGNFNLLVVDIDPIYTLGKIAQSRQKIIEDLRRRGLLERNKLQKVPLVPLNIGLITAEDSAAYHDFINELNSSGYGFKVLVCNCHMQGRLVESDVLKALSIFNKLSPRQLDVIVITRGGGSIADLSYFDNKKIAENLAFLPFAVISALGHQINTTITDMVAHTYCKTPTKAAQFLIERVKCFLDALTDVEKKIINQSQNLIQDANNYLQGITANLEITVSHYFRLHHEELWEKKHTIFSRLKIALARQNETLKNASNILRLSLPKLFKHLYNYLGYLESKINILNPKNILKRGYSITFKNEKALKSITDVRQNDMIKTFLYEGEIISEVKRKEKADG